MTQYASAVFELDGFTCHTCRKESDERGDPVACEMEGGILSDGTCQWGYPAFPDEYVLAWELWQDTHRFGWSFVADLHRLELTDVERGNLVVGMRTIEDAFNEDQRRRMKKTEGA